MDYITISKVMQFDAILQSLRRLWKLIVLQSHLIPSAPKTFPPTHSLISYHHHMALCDLLGEQEIELWLQTIQMLPSLDLNKCSVASVYATERVFSIHVFVKLKSPAIIFFFLNFKKTTLFSISVNLQK